MSEPRDLIDRAVRTLRQPVEIDPAARRRLVATLREEPAPRIGPVRRVWRWLARPRPVMISPLTGLAAAAAIAIIAVVRPASGPGRDAADASVMAAEQLSEPVRFKIVAPTASSVALVGDFNDWDPDRHLLRPSVDEEGVWEIVVPLQPGRHVYSFFVDGSQWIPDPVRAAVEGDLGVPSSVVLVGERSS